MNDLPKQTRFHKLPKLHVNNIVRFCFINIIPHILVLSVKQFLHTG